MGDAERRAPGGQHDVRARGVRPPDRGHDVRADGLLDQAGRRLVGEQRPVDVERDQPRGEAVEVSATTGSRTSRPRRYGCSACRDPHRAVGLLVGLEDRHDRARDRDERAVQRGQRPHLVTEAAPDVEAAGLEVGAVRGRGELAVLALRRDPRLAVELALRAQTQVAGGRVDDAVGQLELAEPLLLPAQQPLVLLEGVLDRGVGEHLHLVEPVHPDDPPGVLAVGACLLAEARAERGVAQRQSLAVEDLVGVVRRQRHLRGADEVHVLALDPVDVVGGLAEEAGALHGPRLHQRRRDHRREAGVAGLVHRHVDQGELEVRADAGQVVEAGARHLGAAVDVDRAEDLAELDVVARLEALGREVAGGADLLEHDVVVLAAGRRLVGGRVRDRHQAGAVGLLGLRLRGLGLLHVGRQRLGAREQRLLLLALRLRDLLAEGLLLGPQPLELDDRGPAPLVRGQRVVDHGGGQPALGLGGTHEVRVVTEQAGIDHPVRLSAARRTPHPGFGAPGAAVPDSQGPRETGTPPTLQRWG